MVPPSQMKAKESVGTKLSLVFIPQALVSVETPSNAHLDDGIQGNNTGSEGCLKRQ